MDKITDFLHRIGVQTPINELTLDGTLQYLKESGGFNGWYRGYSNKFGTELQFGDWRHGSERLKLPAPVPVDEAERLAWEEERKRKEIEDSKLVLEIQDQKSKFTEEVLKTLAQDGQSTYLEKKKVGAYGIYFRFPSKVSARETDVIVPVRDIDGKLWGYQTIWPDGSKDFLPGARIGGCFHLLGDAPSNIVYLAEGYATSASVYEATKRTTACVFFAGNILKVAQAFREKYPDIKIVIAADNDETGLRFAREAEKEYNAFVTFPPKSEGELDFNDYSERYGVDRTRKLLTGASIEPKNRAHFIDLNELLSEPEEDIEYLVGGLLPKGGTSVVAGQPKVGKTTLVRHLIRSVVGGSDFLSRKTAKGKVIYLALEEKRNFLQKKLANIPPTLRSQVKISFKISPTNRLQELEETIKREKPDLAIVDTLYKFIQVKEDNYGEISALLQPLETLARDYNCHIMLVHHAKKGEARGVESVLGSTAIAAAVDTIITIRKHVTESKTEYLLASTNRYGDDIEESLYFENKETGEVWIKKAPTKSEGRNDKVLLYFKENPETWMSPKDVKEGIGGNYEHIKDACFSLSRMGAIEYKKGERGGPVYKANPQWTGQVEENAEY